MQTPAPGSLTLPAMLYINNATPVADTAAENMPLIKAENVDVETKQQSQLPPRQPRAEGSTALTATTPAAESSPTKLASARDSVNRAELLPAVAVVVTGDMPTSTVLQASISPTPTLRVRAESTDKGASITPVTPAAIAVADVAGGGNSKQVSSTPAKPCTTTATTSAVWSTSTTAPPATFASSESTTAIGAAVAAAEAGATLQREQQQYAELRADALSAAATQSATRADARTPLSLGNFETKLQLDPMSLFSGLPGMGSSALFASQALTGAALHPANVNVTEAQLLANQLRAAGAEPAPKANGLFPALGSLSPEDYSRSVDLLRNLATQQHLALLSSGAAPNGASLRDAEVVRQAHTNAILFPTNTSSSNTNPFRASTGPPVNACEATIAKPETAILNQPPALRTSSTKPSTSSLDATSTAAKTAEEGVTASVITAADPTTTRGTATATTNATMATTATVGSAVKADPVAGTPATEATTATPQYTPGRTLTRDELFLAVQAKQFALLRASLLANVANATNGTNSPISAAARSLSARTFGSAQQDSSSMPKVIGTDSKGPNLANIDATSESVTNMLASAMKLLNNDPAALLDFSKATTKERAMLLRTINMQINRTNQVRASTNIDENANSQERACCL